MAHNEAEKARMTRPGSMGRYDPRNTGSTIPYIIGGLILLAVLYMFFGDSFRTQTSTETTVPQTTTAPAPTAPATK